jgi:hypothetical protein
MQITSNSYAKQGPENCDRINIHVVKLDRLLVWAKSGRLDLNDPFYANREVCDTNLEMLDVKAPTE